MTLTVTPVVGIPEVQRGDDLAGLIASALAASGVTVEEGDVLVVSSKVASKALGLTASCTHRESVVADESEWVVAERVSAGRLTRVVKAKAGPVMAAAGVDASNTGRAGRLLLLPRDPDAVCRELHARLRRTFALARLGIILSDTAGRPWRTGQTDFALGAFGIEVTDDLRGGLDADGRPLEVTARAVADELAAAADLVKGKADGVPVAHVRGLGHAVLAGRADMPGGRSLVRTGPSDWFGHGRAEAVRASLGVEPGSGLAERIGIADAGPEPLATRLGRAVATAIHELPDVGVDIGCGDVVVSGEDPFDVGVAVGRLGVALWGEWLAGRVTDRAAGSVRIRVTSRL